MKLHLLSAAFILASAASASAVAYTIDWLDMTPVPVTNPIPNGQTFNLPGYGNVRVSYTSVAPINWTHSQSALAQNGTINYAGDSYNWSTFSTMGAVNGVDGSPSQDYSITFSLLNGPVVGSQLVLGSSGLGHSFDAGFTTAITTVDGTFMGDYDLGAALGPTSFTGGVGGFTLRNSLTEPTNGFFNTDLGVTRLDQNPLTITLSMHHIDEDGIGFTIGRYTPVPEPGSAALGALGLLVLARRRRLARRG